MMELPVLMEAKGLEEVMVRVLCRVVLEVLEVLPELVVLEGTFIPFQLM